MVGSLRFAAAAAFSLCGWTARARSHRANDDVLSPPLSPSRCTMGRRHSASVETPDKPLQCVPLPATAPASIYTAMPAPGGTRPPAAMTGRTHHHWCGAGADWLCRTASWASCCGDGGGFRAPDPHRPCQLAERRPHLSQRSGGRCEPRQRLERSPRVGPANRTHSACAPIWCAGFIEPTPENSDREGRQSRLNSLRFSAVFHPLAFPAGGHMVRALERRPASTEGLERASAREHASHRETITLHRIGCVRRRLPGKTGTPLQSHVPQSGAGAHGGADAGRAGRGVRRYRHQPALRHAANPCRARAGHRRTRLQRWAAPR